MLCVCIGPEEEATFRALRRPLRTLITRSRHEEVRAGAVHTLALACFICSSDDDDTSETLDLLSQVFSKTSDGETGCFLVGSDTIGFRLLFGGGPTWGGCQGLDWGKERT